METLPLTCWAFILLRKAYVGAKPESPHAMSRYYDDTIANSGALRITPLFLQP